MNPLEVYADTGRRQAKAQRHQDAAAVRFHAEWLSRALVLEDEPYRTQAREEYRKAYKEESNMKG